MSLTLHYKGKSVDFSYSISKRRLVAGVVLIGGLSLISSRSTYQPEEAVARIQFVQSGLQQQSQQVENLRTATEQKVAGMLLKLSQVQSEIHRINALGSKLVKQAGLKSEEFSFNEASAPSGQESAAEPVLEGDEALFASIDTMLETLQSKRQQLSALESIMLNHHVSDMTGLEGRPIESGWLSSHYGIRKDPFNGLPAMHKGLDFAGKEGESVVATAAGLVIWAGERYGYGQLVEIDHGNGLITRYGHNKALNVKIGDVVTKGQDIALLGSTGRSTGAHVHYEVLKNGRQQDPLPFVYPKR